MVCVRGSDKEEEEKKTRLADNTRVSDTKQALLSPEGCDRPDLAYVYHGFTDLRQPLHNRGLAPSRRRAGGKVSKNGEKGRSTLGSAAKAVTPPNPNPSAAAAATPPAASLNPAAISSVKGAAVSPIRLNTGGARRECPGREMDATHASYTSRQRNLRTL